jgi:hypothetical protein
MNNWAHQGDIVFVPFTGKVKGTKQNKVTVGWGEVTGHTHDVHCDDMRVEKTESGFILVLGSEGRVTHQEHKDIILAPGTYVVKHEREYDWFAHSTRQVVD